MIAERKSTPPQHKRIIPRKERQQEVAKLRLDRKLKQNLSTPAFNQLTKQVAADVNNLPEYQPGSYGDETRRYLSTVATYPLLTAEQEYELATRARQGEKEAMNTLIEHNLRLVATVANRYPIGDLDERLAEGNLGLILAAKRFDPSSGYRFSTYATWWIQGRILDALRRTRYHLYVPHNVYAIEKKAYHEADQLERELGRPPTDTDLKKRLGKSMYRTMQNARVAHEVTSFNAPLSDTASPVTLSDVVSDPAIDVSQKAIAQVLLDSLPKRHRQILKLRFGFDAPPQSQDEIGNTLGISSERVRQLIAEGLTKLREPSQKDKKETPLDQVAAKKATVIYSYEDHGQAVHVIRLPNQTVYVQTPDLIASTGALQTLMLHSQGLDRNAIANVMGIDLYTVRHYIAQLRKLNQNEVGKDNLFPVMVKAWKYGFLDPLSMLGLKALAASNKKPTGK